MTSLQYSSEQRAPVIDARRRQQHRHRRVVRIEVGHSAVRLHVIEQGEHAAAVVATSNSVNV
jgi:hypothetical protein